MEDFFLENDSVKIGLKAHGAELVSIVDKNSGHEYMWSGDPKYWGRVSPVLFPFVGKLNNQKYRHLGKEYSNIPQHGFARDCEFEIVSQSEDALYFKLIPSEQMKELYPFEYDFYIGYRLEENKVEVIWKVENSGNDDLNFSIGAHPAFMCEGKDTGKKYYLDFHKKDINSLTSGIINSAGVLSERTKIITFENGVLELSEELFSEDALIFDGNGITDISILDENKKPFLSVSFDTPQLGIWSPTGKNAPFVCIEPWYGRCDRADFDGELSQREYANVIKPGEAFERKYTIAMS